MSPKRDHDKCGRGSGKEAPPFEQPKDGKRRERICSHRRSAHKAQCSFCPCGGFVERLAR